MPGSPSRDTYDASKHYSRLRYVGGSGRHLFDAELNELQDLLAEQTTDVLAATFGVTPESYLIGTPIRLAPSTTAGNVLVYHGMIKAGPFTIQTGTTGSSTDFSAVYNTDGSDNTTHIVIYWDVFETVVDSTGDANIVDPTYGIETAHRKKLNWVLTKTKGADDPPSAPSGHYYVKLGVVLGYTAQLPLDHIKNDYVNGRMGIDVVEEDYQDWLIVNALNGQKSANGPANLAVGSLGVCVSPVGDSVSLTWSIPLILPPRPGTAVSNFTGPPDPTLAPDACLVTKAVVFSGIGGSGSTGTARLLHYNPSASAPTTYGPVTLTGAGDTITVSSPALIQNGYWVLNLDLTNGTGGQEAKFYGATVYFMRQGIKYRQRWRQ